jgi:hypothetical protein
MSKWTGRFVSAVALLAFAGLTLVGAEDDKPKFTIKAVMKEAHKSGLYKKVAEGRADKEEKEKLVTLYEALPKNKPPMGDEKEWKKKTEEMLAAAKGCLKDEKGAGAKLAKLVNCKTCHAAFKGK